MVALFLDAARLARAAAVLLGICRNPPSDVRDARSASVLRIAGEGSRPVGGPIVPMVNTDFFQDDDVDNEAPYRTFGLGHGGGRQARVSIRREHR